MLGFDPNRDNRIKTDAGDALRGFLAHLEFTGPVAKSATAVLSATDQTDAEQEITEGITDPDMPRAVTIKGNASGNAGDVVIDGTNINDEVITETIALDGATEVLGTKAFKTITKVTLPAETHAGTDTVSVGITDKLGLSYMLTRNTVQAAYLGDALEGTAPTVAVDADEIEKNTILLNSAMDESDVDVYLIV